MKMIALKRVKYPHGPSGKEYAPGEAFTALSERDAKALYVSGRARQAERDVPVSPAELPSAAAVSEAAPNQEGESRRQYQRRDMQAVDGQTGEDPPLRSSRRGRRQNAPNSES